MHSRWDPLAAKALAGLDLLVYVTRCLGAEEQLVLHGGGNTSAKFEETDHLGRPVTVLRIKGSGWNLATIEPAGFAPCNLEDLIPLYEWPHELDDQAMVDHVQATLLDPAAPRPSIETLLHAFIPEPWILHSHADAILTLCDSVGREATVRAALGERVSLAAYRRPGHKLSQLVGQAYRAQTEAEGVVLMNHGLVTWGRSAEEAYGRHISLVTQAERYLAEHGARVSLEALAASKSHLDSCSHLARLLPQLRGLLASAGPCILHTEQSDLIDRFLDAPELADFSQRGTATPDHLLFTKRVPLILPHDAATNPRALKEALEGYATRYAAEYRAHATGEFAMLDPHPRVLLAPAERALITAADSAKEALRIADIYTHTMAIILGAQALGGYATLDPAEAHRAEYWPLELYKRTLAPKPAEFAGRIVAVTGAGSGIGRAIAQGFAKAGAQVACLDRDFDSATQTAQAIQGRAIACEVSDEASVEAAFQTLILAWGGLDVLISNAGVIVAGEIADLGLADWEKAFAVNATGHFLICRAALRLFQRQGRGGAMVLNCSKNVPLPGGGFGAYSASKAAETQLGRILAIEGAPHGIRVNMLHPDGIFQGSQLWDDTIRRERAEKYGVAPEELAAYYKERNLLKLEVSAEDVAEAALFLASPRARATTGGILTIDGGLPGAFSR